MSRDPLIVIPSWLSLVTGDLDNKFNFCSLDEHIWKRYIDRLYRALLELLKRFHNDWTNNNIDKEKVFIVRFDTMMSDFESLMDGILNFINVKKNENLIKVIQETADSQRQYKSGHKYNLDKFGLTEDQIRNDCKDIYKTFLS